MEMDNIEIVNMYKAAANKKEQIRILADLNAASEQQIAAILERYGVLREKDKPGAEKPKKPGKKRERFVWTAELDDDLRRLAEQGLSVKEIAERMGVDVPKVRSRMNREGIRLPHTTKKAESHVPAETEPTQGEHMPLTERIIYAKKLLHLAEIMTLIDMRQMKPETGKYLLQQIELSARGAIGEVQSNDRI